jgi:hypothetical protein
LSNDTTYYFTVEAINTVGSSQPSAQANATPTRVIVPVLFVADGHTVVARGSHHRLAGFAPVGATVTLYQGHHAVATTTAAHGVFSFPHRLFTTTHGYSVISHGFTSNRLVVHVVHLTLHLRDHKHVVAAGSRHALTGRAPRGLTVRLFMGHKLVGTTTANRHNRYHFGRVFTAAHRYRVKSDGVYGTAITVRVARRQP